MVEQADDARARSQRVWSAGNFARIGAFTTIPAERLATGFVLFTLFVNGTTLRLFIALLGLDRLSPRNQVMRDRILAIAYEEVCESVRERARYHAVAEGAVVMAPATLAMIRAGNAKKGDVVGTARIAGIMAAKRTHELIPLCHPIALSAIAVEIEPDEALPGLRVRATAKVADRTGVEMEALTAVAVACLTIYDMAKAVDRGMEVTSIHLVEKRGGRSGTWRRRT